MKPIFNYNNENLFLISGKYFNERLYLGLVNEEGELWADITINLPVISCAKDEIFINGDISKELKEKIFSSNVFKKTDRKIRYNLGTYDLAKVNLDLIQEYKFNMYFIKFKKEYNECDDNIQYYKKSFKSFEEALIQARKIYNRDKLYKLEITDILNQTIFYKDKEYEDFYLDDIDDKVITKIPSNLLKRYISAWTNKEVTPIPDELIYCEEDGKFIAINNETNVCKTNIFNDEKSARDWLLKKEKNIDMEVDL